MICQVMKSDTSDGNWSPSLVIATFLCYRLKKMRYGISSNTSQPERIIGDLESKQNDRFIIWELTEDQTPVGIAPQFCAMTIQISVLHSFLNMRFISIFITATKTDKDKMKTYSCYLNPRDRSLLINENTKGNFSPTIQYFRLNLLYTGKLGFNRFRNSKSWITRFLPIIQIYSVSLTSQIWPLNLESMSLSLAWFSKGEAFFRTVSFHH